MKKNFTTITKMFLMGTMVTTGFTFTSCQNDLEDEQQPLSATSLDNNDQNTVTSRSFAIDNTVSEDSRADIEKAAKQAMASMLKMVPNLNSFKNSYLNVAYTQNVEPYEDRSVEELQYLNQLVSAIYNQIDTKTDAAISSKFDQKITDHRNFERELFAKTSACLLELASIQYAMTQLGYNKDIHASASSWTISGKKFIQLQNDYAAAIAKINDASKYSVQGKSLLTAAADFIYETNYGYGKDLTPWSSVADQMAIRLFDWEEQGYNFRDISRSRDMLTCMEAALVIELYREAGNNVHNLADFYRRMNSLIKAYNTDKVVRDNDYAICQIPNMNHIKIKKDSFKDIDKNIYRFPENSYSDGYVQVGKTYDEEEINVKGWILKERSCWTLDFAEEYRNLDWFAIPDANFHKNEDMSTWMETTTHMLTLNEAKTLVEYYQGRGLTLRQILTQEAKVIDINNRKNPDKEVLMINGTHVHITRYYDSGYKKVCDIKADEEAYLDRTSKVFDRYEFETWNLLTYHRDMSENDYLLINDFYHNYKAPKQTKALYIADRTNNWHPAAFEAVK